MKTKPQDNNPTPPQSAPDATTYKASENVPSVRTLLPVPSFPKLPEPESSTVPATFSLDKAGQAPVAGPESALHLQTRQVTPTMLQPPTKFDPKLGKHVPVDPAPVDESKPVTSRPIHDVSKAQNQ